MKDQQMLGTDIEAGGMDVRTSKANGYLVERGI